jgi:hypothetical protein
MITSPYSGFVSERELGDSSTCQFVSCEDFSHPVHRVFCPKWKSLLPFLPFSFISLLNLGTFFPFAFFDKVF